MKTCTSCEEEKDLSQFAKNKNRPDGLQSQCRTCMSKKRSPNKGQGRRGTYYPDEFGGRYDDAGY